MLLVDDNRQVMATMADYLGANQVQVDFAYHGQAALQLLQQASFDVIVMDIMMPRLDGISTVSQIRQQLHCQTPILFLTAKDSLTDKEAAFAAGGDDYLVKPFALRELLLRLQALVRRGQLPLMQQLTFGDLRLDLTTLVATQDGRALKLSRLQTQILKILLQKAPALVERDYLTAQIWGDEEPASDALRSHIYAIRQALRGQTQLETLHGQGYKLVS